MFCGEYYGGGVKGDFQVKIKEPGSQ